ATSTPIKWWRGLGCGSEPERSSSDRPPEGPAERSAGPFLCGGCRSPGELAAVDPADPDQAEAQRHEAGDPQQPLEPRGVDQEDLEHRQQDQHQRADPPAALARAPAPPEEAE